MSEDLLGKLFGNGTLWEDARLASGVRAKLFRVNRDLPQITRESAKYLSDYVIELPLTAKEALESLV